MRLDSIDDSLYVRDVLWIRGETEGGEFVRVLEESPVKLLCRREVGRVFWIVPCFRVLIEPFAGVGGVIEDDVHETQESVVLFELVEPRLHGLCSLLRVCALPCVCVVEHVVRVV